MMVERRVKGRAMGYRPVAVHELKPEEVVRASRAAPSFDERMAGIRRGYLESAIEQTRFDSPWFGLRVAFGRELAVEKSLSDLGVECLVPLRKGRNRRLRHRVIEGKMEPAITGYVLVRFVPSNEACVGILAVEHAVSLVGTEGKPHPVTHEEAMRFKAKADQGELDWERESRVSFRRGEKVRVGEGPFSGLPGRVVSARGDARGDAVVEVDVFGRMTPVTLPLAFLEKL